MAFIWGGMRVGTETLSPFRCATREGPRVFSRLDNAMPQSTRIRNIHRGKPGSHVLSPLA